MLAALAAGCEGSGAMVAMNQRMFELPGMTARGSGCMTMQLGSDGSSSGGFGGFGGGGLIVVVRQANDMVHVEVSEGRTLLVRRSYDEAFFRSQRVDEVKVTATTGSGLLLRHWGSYGPDGRPTCAPDSDDGSRPGAQQP